MVPPVPDIKALRSSRASEAFTVQSYRALTGSFVKWYTVPKRDSPETER